MLQLGLELRCLCLIFIRGFVLLAVPETTTEEDEFEKWQREVREAEAEQAVNDKPEEASTPPEGEEEFTDDDGTIYKWDRTLRAWVPQVG